MKMNQLLTSAGFLVLMSALGRLGVAAEDQPSPASYQPTWDSLTRHGNPPWFADAKFGIYFHWGPYAVPAFGSEWYPRNMYRSGSPENKFHLGKFGALDKFGYKDFIPMFKAEKFAPNEWAELFEKAGARFAGPVAEHADGFSMWDSQLTKWNAAQMGPKRDVVGEMELAIRKRGLKFITTFHHQWLWAWYPTLDKSTDASNPADAGLYGPPAPATAFWPKNDPLPPKEFSNLWEAKVKEVIDKYQPDLIWFDSRTFIIDEANRQSFLAYYYNKARSWGRDVVMTYKGNDFKTGSGIVDLERGRMAKITEYPWLNDDSIDWDSWGYIEKARYKPAKRLVDELMDIISKNGCLLLNIGPRADGTIPEPIKESLLGLGAWLKVNGEAVYGTRPWEIFGEGPTLIQEGHFGEEKIKDFTAEDVRFTRKPDALYVTCFGWPADGKVTIKSLAAGKPLWFGEIGQVQMLGVETALQFSRDAKGLTVTMPSVKPCEHAVVLKLTGKK